VETSKLIFHGVLGAIVVVGVIALLWFALAQFLTPADIEPANYQKFAQCLTDNGLKMYGSIYCSHCNAEKVMFGESWQYVTYVECSIPGSPTQAPACTNAGVEAYPTWVTANGQQVLGKQSFLELSKLSGCSLE